MVTRLNPLVLDILLEKKGVRTDEQLSIVMGIDANDITAWRQGTETPDLPTLLLFQSLTGVPYSGMLEHQEEQEEKDAA